MSPDVEEFLYSLFNSDSAEDILKHEYDPAKAREYYLRTRKLKGRHKGVEKPSSPRSSKPVLTAAQVRAKKAANNERLKKIAEARVNRLKARLAKLEKVLDELVKQAKARSGIDSKSKTTPKADPKNAKPLTVAQKREAAKRAKERRDKEGDPSLSAQAKELDAKIKKVRERISKMRAQIAASKKRIQAKAKSDAKTKSKTASNGR